MEILRPDRRLLLVWILYICGGTAIVCGAFNIFTPISPFLPYAVVGATLVLFYCPLRWNNLQYTINNHRLLIQSGVLFKNQKQISFSCIRYVTVFAGPLERVFGIRTVAVYVTGSMTVLEGIPKNTAYSLQTYLVSRCFEGERYV